MHPGRHSQPFFPFLAVRDVLLSAARLPSSCAHPWPVAGEGQDQRHTQRSCPLSWGLSLLYGFCLLRCTACGQGSVKAC